LQKIDWSSFSPYFFPPKSPEAVESLYDTIRELEAYQPHFVSVTYGAGGSMRELTHDLVVRIKQTTSLDPVPHLTCVCHKQSEIADILVRYARAGVSNILSLGGDAPKGLQIPRESIVWGFIHGISPPLGPALRP